MKRLIEYTVRWALVTACRLATVPTNRSPVLVKATTDGVVRPPSELGITVGSLPIMTATHEFVVPRSIPIVLPMASIFLSGSERARPGPRGQALPGSVAAMDYRVAAASAAQAFTS